MLDRKLSGNRGTTRFPIKHLALPHPRPRDRAKPRCSDVFLMPSFRIRVRAVRRALVAGAALAALVAAAPAPAAPGIVPVLYVSPSGTDTGLCTLTAPCKSFARAYKVAQPGQIVEVAGGTYPAQQINLDPQKTSED